MRQRFGLRLLALLLLGTCCAVAAGPRWVAGSPYFYAPGWLVYWYTDNPLYYTDPGDLSQYVTHAQADAIVDAAAGVWNIETSRLTLAKGGTLNEDVSSDNVYVSSTGIVFPADVQSANYTAKQIAVIYDRDGAVTDMLLGSGASNPSGCRQNAVTESVDSIRNDGRILHALLVLNGRCTGPAPEQQLQMQYQLMRAFGRVLGLSWSQTNDNVFTNTPRPTYQQALHWPVMHPIDIICGPYTYQCMPQPFTLRDDDISSLDYIYPNVKGYSHPPGKVDTLMSANAVQGTVTFPNGQGMQGVNVVVRRLEQFWNVPDDWETASSVSGYMFRRRNGNPVSGPLTGPPTIGMGSTDPSYEGSFYIARIPVDDSETWQSLFVITQPVNPLYVGSYAVGPYDVSSVDPSGSTQVWQAGAMARYGVYRPTGSTPGAATGCDTSHDGTELSPAPVPSSGWWNGNLCSYGHAAWLALTVQPGRSFALEVTALDEQGAATTAKMLPVTGIWSASDPTGGLPTVAAAAGAFNSTASAMTTLSVAPATGPARSLRMVIADQKGDGRPDYNYQARVFYAESVSPATVPSFGGTVTISGMGFRTGNAVTVNGVAATVTGWTANTITMAAPALHAGRAVTADVTVRDLTTGATTTMTGALQYDAPQPALMLRSAPGGEVVAGVAAATPFSVQAVDADGVTPLAGVPVSFSVTGGQARFDLCGAAACTIVTDSQGQISTTVTPLAAGAIQVTAASGIGTVSASFTALARVQTVTLLTPELYVAAGSKVTWTLQAALSDNGASTEGVPVLWNSGASGVSFFPSVSVTDGRSIATTAATAGALAAGRAHSTACAWTSVCAGVDVSAVGAEDWNLEQTGTLSQTVTRGVGFSPVVLKVVDGQGHAIAGAPVTIHQTLEPYTAPCDTTDRCPMVPVYLTSVESAVSALDGTVTITPLDAAGGAVVARIAAATGTGGFLSFSATRQP